jgi:hypothetical protein
MWQWLSTNQNLFTKIHTNIKNNFNFSTYYILHRVIFLVDCYICHGSNRLLLYRLARTGNGNLPDCLSKRNKNYDMLTFIVVCDNNKIET